MRVVIQGEHRRIVAPLVAAIEADPNLALGVRPGFASLVVEVKPAGSIGIAILLGQRISAAEQRVLDMLLRAVPHVLTCVGKGAEDENHIVLEVPLHATDALCEAVSRALYRGILRVANVAPARAPARSLWSRLFRRAGGSQA